MKWWVFILLPLSLFSQDTYTTCDNLTKDYGVSYDSKKQYYWDITGGEIISKDKNNITIQWPDSAGEYMLSVWTTRYGCIGDTSYYYVTVEPCLIDLFLPSAFTPNGDGINETYVIKGELTQYIEYLTIFDRWGNKILEEDKYIRWDGGNHPIGIYTIVVLTKDKKYVKNISLVK